MGHYDDDYEYERGNWRKLRLKRVKEARVAVENAISSLPDFVPERFRHKLGDVLNYLYVISEEEKSDT